MTPGDSYTLRWQVTHEGTAAALTHLSGDPFPEVLATTRCIALIELAAGHLLMPLLQPGQLSVGVTVEVKHLAATPVGAWVEATARFLGQEGKMYKFAGVVRDPAGEVMTGTHSRAIIDEARLLDGAKKRAT